MKFLCSTFLRLGVIFLTAGPLYGQTLSPSKLSAHLINAYTSGGSNIVAGSPRVLKVLGLDSAFPSDMARAMRDYKARVPGGKTVVRIYTTKHYSLTDDATKLGRPTGFRITVNDVYPSAGAGFVVAQCGDVMTMPGLPKEPAAERMAVRPDGSIVGLF